MDIYMIFRYDEEENRETLISVYTDLSKTFKDLNELNDRSPSNIQYYWAKFTMNELDIKTEINTITFEEMEKGERD